MGVDGWPIGAKLSKNRLFVVLAFFVGWISIKKKGSRQELKNGIRSKKDQIAQPKKGFFALTGKNQCRDVQRLAKKLDLNQP